ncbi:MAG: HEAT repeat domain-containing protein [Planctomycetota bacterium]
MASATGLQRTLRTLVATSNGAAIDTLLAVLDSPQAAVRVGSARALAARADADSHARLLAALDDKPADVQRAIKNPDAAARLRGPAVAAISGEDAELCQRVCRYAVESEDHELLAAIVDAAIHPDHPAGETLATSAIRLATSLASALSNSEPGSAQAVRQNAARRGALQSLGRAVERFGQHKHQELVDAILLLATVKSPVLRLALRDESHPARDALLDSLHHSQGSAAMELLIGALEDENAPPELLTLAAERCDRPYLQRMFRHVGERPGARVRNNARNIESFAWAKASRVERLVKLNAAEQAAAVRLFNAAKTDPEERKALADLMLTQGAASARVAACESLRRLRGPDVGRLLDVALADISPDVVAAAAGQLRRQSVENGLEKLAGLLDHFSRTVVAAAQRAMGDFSLESYREAYPRLTDEQRRAAGSLVAKADPAAVETIAGGLDNPVVNQRLEALSMIADLQLVGSLVDRVIKAASDSDVGVRAEAARCLGEVETEESLATLHACLDDGSESVKLAAKESLLRLGHPSDEEPAPPLSLDLPTDGIEVPGAGLAEEAP